MTTFAQSGVTNIDFKPAPSLHDCSLAELQAEIVRRRAERIDTLLEEKGCLEDRIQQIDAELSSIRIDALGPARGHEAAPHTRPAPVWEILRDSFWGGDSFNSAEAKSVLKDAGHPAGDQSQGEVVAHMRAAMQAHPDVIERVSRGVYRIKAT
jgi:hypothetical protein